MALTVTIPARRGATCLTVRTGCAEAARLQSAVATYLEVWQPEGIRVVLLDTDRTTVGSALSNAVVITSDPSVSRLHAVLERFAPGRCLRDLGSCNGTFVNGEGLSGDRVLHPGDEIRMGRTRLVYRGDPSADDDAATAAPEPAPS